MTTHRITFGKVGETYPVPPLTLAAEDDNEFHRAVAAHAVPHLRPALTALGRPELADCIFEFDSERTHGNFLWLDVLSGQGARFCGARIEQLPDEPPGDAA